MYRLTEINIFIMNIYMKYIINILISVNRYIFRLSIYFIYDKYINFDIYIFIFIIYTTDFFFLFTLI